VQRLGTYGRCVAHRRADAAAGPAAPTARSPLLLILLASGAVALMLGEPVDAAVISGVVAVNAVIGYLEEARAETALDALRSMVRTRSSWSRRATRYRPICGWSATPSCGWTSRHRGSSGAGCRDYRPLCGTAHGETIGAFVDISG
jgi:hypothetical protein